MNLITTIITTVIGLFPQIIQAVQAVEAAMPEGTAGTTKLALVQTILQTSYTAEQSAAVAFEKIWPTINSVITTVVADFKAVKAAVTATEATAAQAAPTAQ